jgi:transposase
MSATHNILCLRSYLTSPFNRNGCPETPGIANQLDTLVANVAPTLLSRLGGKQHAAQLLITAGENIDRLTSEAAFARLCGVAPTPASSGNTHRMRLHRGGDRRANSALHMIIVCRLRYDQRTIDYMNRRRAEGLSKKDVIRCLKRFVAREVFRDLKVDLLRN